MGKMGLRVTAEEDLDPTEINDKAALIKELRVLGSQSSYTYKALGTEIKRPTTTVHGWFTGGHVPYQRDNDLSEALLSMPGVADSQDWMAALAQVRAVAAIGSTRNPYQGLAPTERPMYADSFAAMNYSSESPGMPSHHSGTQKSTHREQ
jgi:hypothetical protein